MGGFGDGHGNGRQLRGYRADSQLSVSQTDP